jgi:hypothetical protein
MMNPDQPNNLTFSQLCVNVFSLFSDVISFIYTVLHSILSTIRVVLSFPITHTFYYITTIICFTAFHSFYCSGKLTIIKTDIHGSSCQSVEDIIRQLISYLAICIFLMIVMYIFNLQRRLLIYVFKNAFYTLKYIKNKLV